MARLQRTGRTGCTPASWSPPSIQLPCIERLPGYLGIVVVSVDKLALTVEVTGPEPFLRRAEAKLLRAPNVALLGGEPVVLQRANWTQLGHTALRANFPIGTSFS